MQTRTLAIFELLLDYWIVDVGHDLISLQFQLHAVHSDLLSVLASACGIIHSHDLCDPDTHVLDLFDFF